MKLIEAQAAAEYKRSTVEIFAGVDGCRGGWFVERLNSQCEFTTDLVQDAQALAPIINQSTLTLIDIPIGLLDAGGPQRECDRLARISLGSPRAASVFSVPSRSAVYAATYAQSCRLNLCSLGRKLSKQTWNITGKIREIDQLLRNHFQLRRKLRESHPEICFWALNGRQAMRFNKKTREGRGERMRVLTRYLPQAPQLLETAAASHPRAVLGFDDILDAMALAVSGRLGGSSLCSFPVHPEFDSAGNRMEIAYWSGMPET